MSALKNWYVEFPTYRYNEDVVALAQQHGLIIIDAALVAVSNRVNSVETPPALTLRPQYAPKKAAVKPVEPEPAKAEITPSKATALKGADAIKAAEGG